jgi:hypothetical protein
MQVTAQTPSVAAMQFSISDSASVAFARGFYTALAHARGVDESVSAGRIAILGTSGRTLEWVTPVLYLRGNDARLFSLSHAVAPSSLARPLADQVEISESGASSPHETQPVAANHGQQAGAYNALLEELLSALSALTTEDSAHKFVSRSAERIRAQAVLIPEFYVGEFLDMLKDGIVGKSREEIAVCEQMMKDAKSEAAAAEVEFNARLKMARDAGDRAAAHAVWHDREEIQAACQGRVDAAARRVSSASIRMDAFKDLASLLEIDFT